MSAIGIPQIAIVHGISVAGQWRWPENNSCCDHCRPCILHRCFSIGSSYLTMKVLLFRRPTGRLCNGPANAHNCTCCQLGRYACQFVCRPEESGRQSSEDRGVGSLSSDILPRLDAEDCWTSRINGEITYSSTDREMALLLPLLSSGTSVRCRGSRQDLVDHNPSGKEA